MAQLLIRNLDPKVVERLKRQAKAHGRSLQAEAKRLLEENTVDYSADAMRRLADLRRRLKGRGTSDSVALIREDRDR